MQSMESFLWFLGRFHVLVLHLPIGILTLAALFEVLYRFRPFAALRPALAPLWVAGAISAVATLVLGFLHASESAFQGMPAVDAHRWAGVWLCVAACIGAVARTWAPRLQERLWFAPVAAVVALMVVTGHLGGNLTHGDAYLVQYAPAPLRALAGLPPIEVARPRPTDLASADVFLDVIHPALQKRCASCHNESKRSGGLSVVSHDALIKGGKEGVVIKAGDPSASDLFRRVSLDANAEGFMPKEGKTPLTADEVAALGWWIEQGAPASGIVGAMELSASASAAIEAMLGLKRAAGEKMASGAAASEAALPETSPADEGVIAKLVADGFIVRQVARDSNLLDVDYASPRPLSRESMGILAQLGPSVLRLNLRSAGITDESLKELETLTNLRHLRLEKNDITDDGVKSLASLTSLTSLNLTGTRITDKGLSALAQLDHLELLYVWATPITPGAVKNMTSRRKDLRVVAGLKAADVPRPEKVVPPDA